MDRYIVYICVLFINVYCFHIKGLLYCFHKLLFVLFVCVHCFHLKGLLSCLYMFIVFVQTLLCDYDTALGSYEFLI